MVSISGKTSLFPKHYITTDQVVHMNTEIAQVVALTTYANTYLSGRSLSFTLNHVSATFCKRIEFIEIPMKSKFEDHAVIADSPNAWFDYLKRTRSERVRLHYAHSKEQDIADHIGAAFAGGGGRWLIEVMHGETSDIWEPLWRVTKGTGDRIWEVYYVLLARDWNPIDQASLSIEAARTQLYQALTDITAFAENHEDTLDWSKVFLTARDWLDRNEPIIPSNLSPDHPSEQAEQLIAAVFHGWVFGGMGSLNDIVFRGEDQVQYDKVSEALYEALCQSMVAVANNYPIG